MSTETNQSPETGAPSGTNLPFAYRPTPHQAIAARTLPRATFISQLIAERHRLPPQRERRRATVDVAVSAYAETEHNAVRRMPPGYRTTVLA